MEDDPGSAPESLLPYDEWMEEALRLVMLRALEHVAQQGLPGGHHFYITFRTAHPGVSIPARLREQYPEEMTIVLQHQFWDLDVDEAEQRFSIGLSFGGVPSTLVVPFEAITAFADPFVRQGMRFRQPEPPPAPEPATASEPEAVGESKPSEPQVVSLDAFRRRTPPKE